MVCNPRGYVCQDYIRSKHRKDGIVTDDDTAQLLKQGRISMGFINNQ